MTATIIAQILGASGEAANVFRPDDVRQRAELTLWQLALADEHPGPVPVLVDHSRLWPAGGSVVYLERRRSGSVFAVAVLDTLDNIPATFDRASIRFHGATLRNRTGTVVPVRDAVIEELSIVDDPAAADTRPNVTLDGIDVRRSVAGLPWSITLADRQLLERAHRWHHAHRHADTLTVIDHDPTPAEPTPAPAVATRSGDHHDRRVLVRRNIGRILSA